MPAAMRVPRTRPKVKRTKTFTGCWTCRARRVKCDTVRPVCRRCTKSNRCCAGYGVRLVWGQEDDDADNSALVTGNHETQVTRPAPTGRILFSREDMANPTFSEELLDMFLDRLEYFEEYVRAGLGNEIELGPYTVFAPSTAIFASDESDVEEINVPPDISSRRRRRRRSTGSSNSSGNRDEISATPTASECEGWDLERKVLHAPQQADSFSQHGDRPLPILTLQQRLLPFLQPFMSSSSAAERRLLHFWVTSASSIMTSTGHPDNPFRQVVIPIALEAAGSPHKLPGHAALLHIIYAFAGFHMAQLMPSDQSSRLIATKHHQASLQHLRQSLSENPKEQFDAILAVIIIMISIDTLNGQSGQWRIHMRGAREWLRQIGQKGHTHAYRHVLYQMFECLEIFGQSQTRTSPLRSGLALKQDPKSRSVISATSAVEEEPYCLDIFFGVTQPVLEIITRVNRLVGSEPTQEELAEIEHKILLANPSTLRFPGSRNLEQITRRHACATYYSAVIYYQRSVLHQTSNDIQYLVEQSLYHLEAYLRHTEDQPVAGLYWPVCVTACEARDEELRAWCLGIMSRKQRHGIRAINQVKEVVVEVWRRRDSSDDDQEILWQDVMEELKIDTLFC